MEWHIFKEKFLINFVYTKSLYFFNTLISILLWYDDFKGASVAAIFYYIPVYDRQSNRQSSRQCNDMVGIGYQYANVEKACICIKGVADVHIQISVGLIHCLCRVHFRCLMPFCDMDKKSTRFWERCGRLNIYLGWNINLEIHSLAREGRNFHIWWRNFRNSSKIA